MVSSSETAIKPKRDLTGIRFGKLVVIDYVRTYNGSLRWVCACDCGNNTNVRTDGLTLGCTKSCGCARFERHDIIGKKFGSLTAVEYIVGSRSTKAKSKYKCVCDCGKEVLITKGQLDRGKSSCGCAAGLFNFNRKSGLKRHASRLDAAISKKSKIYKKRCDRIALEFSLEYEETKRMFTSNCAYCGVSPNDGGDRHGLNGIDRLDSFVGYTKSNSVPCCWTCNAMKLRHTHSGFMDHIKKIIAYQPSPWESPYPGGFEVCY